MKSKNNLAPLLKCFRRLDYVKVQYRGGGGSKNAHCTQVVIGTSACSAEIVHKHMRLLDFLVVSVHCALCSVQCA